MGLRVWAREDYQEITHILLRRKHLTAQKVEGERKERFEDAGVEGWSGKVTNQGMLAATRSWKNKHTHPIGPQGAQSCQHLDICSSGTNFTLLASRTMT